MTTEPVPPEVLHAWAIYLQASEEARRRGDRRIGTDHILLALFEDPSVEAVLGVSLQQARQALDVARSRSPGCPGPGVRRRCSRAADARRAEEAEDQRLMLKKDRLRMTPAAKKVLEEASKPNRRKLQVTGPAGAGPDPHPPTTRSCGGAAGRSRREHVRGPALHDLPSQPRRASVTCDPVQRQARG